MNFTKVEGEEILKEGKANKANFINAQGGKLTLTNKRIVFVGNKINLGTGTVAIDLEDILTFDKAFAFSIFLPIPIPNALSIVTKAGKKYKFIVSGRKTWLADIANALEKAKKKVA